MDEIMIDIAIEYCIKLYAINLGVYFSFKRITNTNIGKTRDIVLILLSNLIISLISTCMYYVNFILSIIVLVTAYSITLGIILKMKLGYSLIIGIISYALCMIIFTISTLLAYIPYKLAYNLIGKVNSYASLMMIICIHFILLYNFLKLKRFKNGFSFLNSKLNNDFTDMVIINVSTILILMYCLIGSYKNAYNRGRVIDLLITFGVLAITMIVTIQRTLTMYYKQKLMKETIADYERQLKEKTDENEKLKNEKFNISKITHEFYNRQKALEMAVKSALDNKKLSKENFSMETANELGALDKIENLSNEYSEELKKMKSLQKLPLTEIPEIDDMFKYMQAECDKSDIEFKLKISGNMFYLVNHIIPKNKLATMIGDHIRDAIIAVNSSETDNKEILVILGIKDKKYELCIYDTGIEFQIDTLLKLGLEPATTHKETGGTGIGFITTFETLSQTKGSLIIKELPPTDKRYFTKAVIIRFDNKHQYKICSYRADEIKKSNKSRKIIIEELENEDKI